MPNSQQEYLHYITMDYQEIYDEGMYFDCPSCKRTNIYVGDLLFCERCGSTFCINCDMAESMRFAHPDWPCPECPPIDFEE